MAQIFVASANDHLYLYRLGTNRYIAKFIGKEDLNTALQSNWEIRWNSSPWKMEDIQLTHVMISGTRLSRQTWNDYLSNIDVLI